MALLKTTMIYAPGVILPRVAAFLGLILLARVLPSMEFGLYSLTILIGEACDAVLINWVRIAHLRLDQGRNSDLSVQRLNRRLFLIALAPAVLLVLAACAMMAPEAWMRLSIATAFYVLANGFLKNVLTSLRASGRSVAFAVLEGCRSVALIAALLGLVTVGVGSFLEYSLAASAVTLMAAAVAGWPRPGLADSGAAADIRERFTLGVPLIVVGAVATAASIADRTVLEAITDTATFGVYALVYALGRQPVDLVANAVNTGSFPELIRRHEGQGPAAGAQYLRQVSGLLVVLTTLCGLTMTVAAVFLLPIFVPAAGAQGPVVIGIVALASVLTNLKTFASDQVFHATKENWKQTLSLLPAVVAAIAVSVLLAPHLGMIGASLGFLAGGAAGLGVSVVLGWSYLTGRAPNEAAPT